MKKLGLVILVLATVSTVAGCGGKPVALAVCEDATASSAEGRGLFETGIQKTATKSRLGRGAWIGVFRITDRPGLAWAGRAQTGGREVRAELAKLRREATRNLTSGGQAGSDPAGAIRQAAIWLQGPAYREHRRVLIVWSDCINDPTKKAGSVIRTFNDIKSVGPLLEGIEVHVFGLDVAKVEELRKAWQDIQPTPTLHQAGEALEPDSLGLHPAGL